ncbi:MAG: PIN domain-containing protein [Nanoarchaeota archaeon]
MSTEIFFCDTYALIEIIGGNENYKKYENSALVTSEFNLMELYYHLLRVYGKEKANRYFDYWLGFCVDLTHTAIKIGMEIKLANKKEKLSYIDCVGYAFSLEREMHFLTGDSKFKTKEGVEFVK